MLIEQDGYGRARKGYLMIQGREWKCRIYVQSVLIMALMVMGFGCAGTHKSTRTQTTTIYPNGSQADEAFMNAKTQEEIFDRKKDTGAEQVLSTVTTTTDTETQQPGILSATFHAIGYVVSLPFIMVGGLLKIIFGG